MSATVMITTGGTGGHVFPGLAVAAKLVARGCRVFWLGTREGLEARLVPQHGVDFESVSFRVVLGFGGFASFPGALMGVASGRPLVVHDANAVAGLANRILAYGADRILLGFPHTFRGRF